MITHFKKLFDYDSHSTLSIIDTMKASGITTGKPAEVMAHMLAAQQIWLLRCKGLPAPGGPLWPDQSVEEMTEITGRNYQDWMDYLDLLQPNNLAKTITYQTSRGDVFTNSITDIIAHVINHGTHHRGQIGALLKFAGVEILPVTDYILYIRGL